MRAVFGIVSLLLVVAVVGILAKKQLTAVSDIKTPQTSSPVADAPAMPPISPSGNAQQQSQQIQQQFKAAAEAGLQQARPMPDDKP